MDYAPTPDITMSETTHDKLHFSHWPAFAAFIRKNHMVEYARALLDLSREADLPIMKLIAHLPEEQLLDMTIQGHGEFLENVEKNILTKHLRDGLKKWEDDELGIVSPDEIAMEDITVGTFIRKKAMLKLIPYYTTDAYEIVSIIKEIDTFDSEAITVSTALYIKLQKKKEERILQELQDSRELYKQAQAISHLGNWSWDLISDELTWSEEMFRIYGLEPKDGKLHRSEFLHLRHPDDSPLIEEHIRTLRETHEPQEYYFRTIPINGKIKILHAHAEVVLGTDGEPIQLHGTIQDVTEKQNILGQLQHSEELYKQAQAISHIGNWEWEIDGNVISWSDELYRIFGLEPGSVEIDFDKYTSFIHKDDKDSVLAGIHGAMTSGEPFENYYRITTPAGIEKIIFSRGELKTNSNGAPEQMYGTCQDVTREKTIEQELQQKNIELSNSNSSLQDYAYITSHDLKEPLRKITTFSSILINTQSKGLSDEGRMYLNKISDAAMRMQAMISDLLTISTISGNKAFENYSLQQVAQEAIQRLEHKIEDKKAKVHVGELPAAHIVPAQFRQLFQNLVNNSLKFTRKDVTPEINISATYITPSEARKYGVRKASRYICLEFSDNGIGFDNAYAEKIFSIFQRLHGQGEYEGTGIGLSICRKVVENHGGVISASGAMGEGAKFTNHNTCLIMPSSRTQ